jgi:hypothetical protein
VSASPEIELAGVLFNVLRPLIVELVRQEVEERLVWSSPTRWLTVEEAAEQRRTTAAAIRARCERGQIAGATRDGRRWLVPDLRPAPATLEADHNKRGERRGNGPAPGTGG